ncbi:DUF6907 domain-containing protein [Streptomyces sp. NPDC055817]
MSDFDDEQEKAQRFVERAFPEVAAFLAGERDKGTVTLETLDHGTITVPEPEWCRGHDDYRPVHRGDITHNGAEVALRVETALGPAEALGVWISQAPYSELQPEPVPVAAVDIDDGLSLDPDGLRALAREVLRHVGRLYRVADELERLREDAS